MSLSNPKNIANPVERYYEWKYASIIYYDKEAKATFTEELPISFVMLDQLVCVSGFHDPTNCGIYSNEVRFNSDILTVKTQKNLPIAKGTWESQKAKIKNEGGRFAKSVYAAQFFRDENKQVKFRLVRFLFVGAAVNAWIKLDAKDDGSIIQIIDKVERKKGSKVYFEPVFKKLPASSQLLPTCIDLDKQLQKYLEAKLSQIEIEQDIIEDVPEIDNFSSNEFSNEPANDSTNEPTNDDLKPQSYSVDDLPF